MITFIFSTTFSPYSFKLPSIFFLSFFGLILNIFHYFNHTFKPMKSSFSYIPPLSCSAHSLALNPSMTYGHSEQGREGPCDLAPAYLSHIIYHTLCHSHHSGYSYLLTLFKHTKLISTSGALHFLFLLPEVISPQLFLWPSSSFLSSLPLSATPQRAFRVHLAWMSNTSSFPAFFFIIALITS